MIELKRDIYTELIKWKEEDTGKVLELKGARQVGKTYILNKFAKENYKRYFYINMMQTSGREFLECYRAATEWKPGEDRIKRPLHKTLKLFAFHSRFYFKDVGLTRHFLRMTGADKATIQGIVNENFVYLYLEKLIRNRKIAGTAPAFGVYKGGEIDFFLRNPDTNKDYAIEVKSGKNIGKTANMI